MQIFSIHCHRQSDTDIKHEMGKTISSMSLMKMGCENLPPSQRSSLFLLAHIISKLNLCEGGSFSPTIFNSFPHFVFYICLSVCRFKRVKSINPSAIWQHMLHIPSIKKLISKHFFFKHQKKAKCDTKEPTFRKREV